MNTKIILALTLIVAASAASANPSMYRCEGAKGETLLTDRPVAPTCDQITLDPWPVDKRPETYYGRLVVVAPQPVASQVAGQ